jgi:hypothetical protein
MAGHRSTTPLLIVLALLLAGCARPANWPALPPTATSTPSPSPTPTLTPTPTDTPTLTPTLTPTATPLGCLQPPNDYTRVVVSPGIELNRRTLAMLEHAQALYGGPHNLLLAVTQGSYNPGEVASFGTHDGGGALDLSVLDLATASRVLTEEIDPILRALRRAGFAAWLRAQGELYPGSPIHIHAIAIGDAELSPAAARQLTGPEGYFRGFNGIPVDPPLPDLYGGPDLCPWMLEMGYADVRGVLP